jgi:ceramide glucosyltransferase
MIAVLAGVTAVLALVGVTQALVAARLVAGFAGKPVDRVVDRPAVTVLKPLHGDEPLLEAALTTLFRQDYPNWQIVFGMHDEADPAAAVVRRLQQRFPAVDMVLVVDAAEHGVNRKVGNLINMMPAARHDVLVIADSDVHARPDYLDRLAGALQQPGVGLVTTLYAGLPVRSSKSWLGERGLGRRHTNSVARADKAVAGWANPRSPGPDTKGAHDAAGDHDTTGTIPLASRLGATHITHGFLPGAVLARAFGRQDCLGATMCLRRRDLARIGGFPALVDHLADDNVLGGRVAALGLEVVLAQTVPLTTVPEAHLSALFQHELRWARTIRALAPMGFAASALQYPLAWGLLTIVLSGGAIWSIGLFLIVWVLRALAALWVDGALAPLWTDADLAPLRGDERSSNDEAALAFCCPVWLLPLRDVLSVAVMLASYGGRHVVWRGYGYQADTPPSPVTLRPLEGIKPR